MALLFQLKQTLRLGFAAAWARWPRKDKKIDAEKAWNQKVKDTETEDKIHQAFDWQIPMLLERDPQYRPLLGSWLRGEEWNNEKPAPKTLMPNRTIGRPETDAQTQQRDVHTKIQMLIDRGLSPEDAKRTVYTQIGWIKK